MASVEKFITLKKALDKASYNYSEKYLIYLIRQGRLKAFKVDDSWLTTTEWLDQCHNKILKQLDYELSNVQTDDIKQLLNKQKRAWTKKQKRALVFVLTAMTLVFLIIADKNISLSEIKYNDEQITAGWHGFLKKTTTRMSQVAGATEGLINTR